MIELKGNSLPKRQKELNEKVKATVLQKTDFNEIKILEEKSDVDRLYKIDVASEYKEVTYILETFTSGDPLYISRALKSVWLFSDEYAHVINPEYLDTNIFPFMSVKMVKKLLTTVSIHVRNEERALDFYNYCVKNKLKNFSLKFLLFTSEENKLSYFQNKKVIPSTLDMVHFIGNSFQLLEVYLQILEKNNYTARDLHRKHRHMYSVSNEKYLDLFEIHCNIPFDIYQYKYEFGLRISKDILTKHKERVLKLPNLYIWHLNINIILKYLTVEDIKLCFRSLMPCHVKEFWKIVSCSRHKFLSLLKGLPKSEVYSFLKEAFAEKYPGEPFESGKKFYQYDMFQLMTPEERETWAVNHLKDNIELLGKDEEHIWCKYVKFQLSFKEIKRYISISNYHQKRTEMLKILIDAAKTEDELETAITYYYDRHVNEKDHDKIDFIDKIYDDFNVFKFGESCWTAYNKVLYSLKVYRKDFYLDQFRTLSIIYHLIKNKDVPETLEVEVLSETRLHYFSRHQKKLTADENKLIYEYYVNLYTNKLQSFEGKTYDKKVKNKIRPIASSFILILSHFNKTKQDCPEILMKYINLDWENFKHLKFLVDHEEISENTLKRQLKQDSNVIIEKLPDLKQTLSSFHSFRLNGLMKKIKVYFSNDIALQILSVFESWMKDTENMTCSVYKTTICSMFQIADEEYKLNLMSKYVPTSSKIAHNEIDEHVLRVQDCICRFVQYSRPPVPLQELLKYLKGDYVRYCLPLFNCYAMNLPRPLALQFVAAILDAPVSLQKHGLRLAFKCFNVDELKKLLLDVWSKTKNISLRMIIYKGLFQRIIGNEDEADGLYEILKVITLDLNENDDDEIFDQFKRVMSLPAQLRGNFLELIWTAVDNLPNKKLKSFDRKGSVIKIIKAKIEILDREFCRTKILDKFIKEILLDEKVQVQHKTYEIKDFVDETWNLTAKYIVKPDSPEQVGRSVELAGSILRDCVGAWDLIFEGRYVVREFIMTLTYKIITEATLNENKGQGKPVLEFIINLLEEILPINRIYLLYCELNITVISLQVMEDKKIISANGEISYKHINCDEEIASEFAGKVVKFLLDFKERGILFTSFYRSIAKLISDVVVSTCLDTKLNRNRLAILVSDRLFDTEILEARIIAAFMLPTEAEEQSKALLEEVSEKINEVDNDEIQSIMQVKMYSIYVIHL